ncbi:MAG: 3-dehydroquinate synthase II [Firmicutes bacterium]|nr:3-dehydroquinate synthase II [Bacillota bacterium]
MQKKKEETKNLRQREVWFDGREIPLERRDIWDVINNSAIKKVVVGTAQRRKGRYPLKTKLITEIKDLADLAHVSGGETVMSDKQELLEAAKEQGYSTCVFLSVEGREALERSWQDALKYDYAVVDFDLPTNIPLELIIARLQKRETVLLKREKDFTGAEVAFGVLEHGSDGVLFNTLDINEIIKLSNFLTTKSIQQVEMHNLTVTEVRHVGMGVRACVDTTGLMSKDEGMVVGSTSEGGIFVCSETHYLPYMNLRPFRVNAGAIHSYIWMPDDKAEYISDLAVGSKILCVNTKGEARELTVGRIKIEVRPLLLIKGEAAGKQLNVIVQDDWHIRVMGAGGQPVNATAIRPGSKLLAYVCEPGRHVGIKVEETIMEK